MTYHGECWVYYKLGEVRLETRSFECGPSELLVKVRMCGRCGTDSTIFRKGHKSVDPYAPVVLGHELVAEIIEVGGGVKDLTEGIGFRQESRLTSEYLDFKASERVVFQGRIARYRDGLMLIPDPIANLSFRIDGGYAQYMKVPAEMIRSESVLRVPENVSDEAACLVEPTACVLESIFATPHPIGVDADGRHQYRAGIRRAGRTCIIGSGTVSMIYALLARHEGAKEVFILLRSEEKAGIVRRTLGEGYNLCITGKSEGFALAEKLAAEKQLVGELRERTGGELFDDVVCACADPHAQRLMPQLYAPDGYAVGACFGGTHEVVDKMDMDLHHYRAAKTIGTSGCSTAAMKTILEWLREGSLKLDGFADPRHWTFRDSPSEFFLTAGSLKPVLYPWGR